MCRTGPADGEAITLPKKTTSFQQWAKQLTAYAGSETLRKEADYWLEAARAPEAPLPLDYPGGTNAVCSQRVLRVSLPEGETKALLTEVPRALRRARFSGVVRRRAQRLLARLALVDVDRRVLSAAAALEPPALRTLDAIHLATALVVREDLAGLVTYDRRLAVAAERLDLEVLAPS